MNSTFISKGITRKFSHMFSPTSIPDKRIKYRDLKQIMIYLSIFIKAILSKTTLYSESVFFNAQ